MKQVHAENLQVFGATVKKIWAPGRPHSLDLCIPVLGTKDAAGSFLFSVHICPCLMLPAIVPQLFDVTSYRATAVPTAKSAVKLRPPRSCFSAGNRRESLGGRSAQCSIWP